MPDPFYSDDFVTIYHGDCLELADLWTCADVLVTDPPYGIDWAQPSLPPSPSRGKSGSKPHDGIQNDRDTAVRDASLKAWGTTKPAIVFASPLIPVPGSRQVLTWRKPSNTGFIGAVVGYRRDTEAIHLVGRHIKRPVQRSSVLETGGSLTDYLTGEHPHAKPTSLLSTLIEWTEGVIADPFAGSGSTLVAAKRLGRRVIGIELEEKYCEIAANRCSEVMVLPMREPEPVVEDLRLL